MLWHVHTAHEWDWDRYRELDQHHRKQLVLVHVPFWDQWFLRNLFGPIAPGSFPVRCEYAISPETSHIWQHVCAVCSGKKVELYIVLWNSRGMWNKMKSIFFIIKSIKIFVCSIFRAWYNCDQKLSASREIIHQKIHHLVKSKVKRHEHFHKR